MSVNRNLMGMSVFWNVCWICMDFHVCILYAIYSQQCSYESYMGEEKAQPLYKRNLLLNKTDTIKDILSAKIQCEICLQQHIQIR